GQVAGRPLPGDRGRQRRRRGRRRPQGPGRHAPGRVAGPALRPRAGRERHAGLRRSGGPGRPGEFSPRTATVTTERRHTDLMPEPMPEPRRLSAADYSVEQFTDRTASATLVIPALNEAERVSHTVAAAQVMQKLDVVDRLLVADGGSTDDTMLEAE